MKKIDWKTKLTSRKFWLAVISLLTSILIIFNVPELTIEQVTTLVLSFATVIAYIIGEGMVDAARVKSEEPQENIYTIEGDADE